MTQQTLHHWNTDGYIRVRQAIDEGESNRFKLVALYSNKDDDDMDQGDLPAVHLLSTIQLTAIAAAFLLLGFAAGAMLW